MSTHTQNQLKQGTGYCNQYDVGHEQGHSYYLASWKWNGLLSKELKPHEEKHHREVFMTLYKLHRVDCDSPKDLRTINSEDL